MWPGEAISFGKRWTKYTFHRKYPYRPFHSCSYGLLKVWIPIPFPIQWTQKITATGIPTPVIPYIHIGECDVIGVKVIGIFPDFEIQWGSLCLQNGYFDPEEFEIQKLDEAGLLVPQSARAARANKKRYEEDNWSV